MASHKHASSHSKVHRPSKSVFKGTRDGSIYDVTPRDVMVGSAGSVFGSLVSHNALSPAKARKILRDGMVNDRILTRPQRAFFGLIAGGGTPTRL